MEHQDRAPSPTQRRADARRADRGRESPTDRRIRQRLSESEVKTESCPDPAPEVEVKRELAPAAAPTPATALALSPGARAGPSASADGAMKQAPPDCKRPSRAARPSEPSPTVRAAAEATVAAAEAQLKARGLQRVAADPVQRYKPPTASTGKGPAIRVGSKAGKDQARANHVMTARSRSINSNAADPPWLLNGVEAPKVYTRLAQDAIRANAVNSVIVEGKQTSQGGANQTTRILAQPITDAAAAQSVAVALSTALARRALQHELQHAKQTPVLLANPMGTNAANPTLLWRAIDDGFLDPDCEKCGFVVTMSTHLVLNATPTKLTAASVLQTAQQFARQELAERRISACMGNQSSHMLRLICNSIVSPGDYALDAVWSSWVLIVYLGSHPWGRAMLRETSLTDVDYQAAATFEAYGRAEVTRRERFEQDQLKKGKAAKERAAEDLDEADDDGHDDDDGSDGHNDDELDDMLEDDESEAVVEGDDEAIATDAATDAESEAVPAADAESELGAPAEASGDGTADDDELVRLQREMRAAQARILGTKRKRGPKGGASNNACDSAGLIEWWSNALCCDNASVLVSMMAHSKRAARKAACATLQRQAGASISVAENEILRGISEQNAVDSAQALAASFVSRKPHEAPTWLVWDWNGGRYLGMARTFSEASTTTAHACRLASRAVQPAGMAIAWSEASLQYAPRSDGVVRVPGVLEQLHAASVVEDAGGKKAAVRAERMSGMALVQAEPPRSTECAGLARSVISFRATLRRSSSHSVAALALMQEALAMVKRGEEEHGAAATDTTGLAPQLRASSDGSNPACPAEQRVEPLCTPASWLAVGIAINEELRGWKASKARKNDPLKVLLGVAAQYDKLKDVQRVLHSEPLPLLTIVDYQLEALATPDGHAPGEEHADGLARVGVALHVCGDSVIRLPEALDALTNADAKTTDGDPASHCRGVSIESALRKRALLWAASSQASYVGNVGSVIAAGYVNTAVQGSKKVSVPDTNRWLGLSAFDAYAAGLVGVDTSHVGTPYAGVYGCPFDSGVTPPGIEAQNYNSDKRQHGSMCCSQEVADDLAPFFASKHWIETEDGKGYVEAPKSARGIPHHLVPGVHGCFDHYLDALQTLRDGSQRNVSAVDSVMVLPCSPWSQALPPVIEATADLSTRLCVRDPALASVVSGCAYLPDGTDERDALLREPLFRRPMQASVADNPWATSYEYLDTFFNAANHLVLLARQLNVDDDDPLTSLWSAMHDFVTQDGTAEELYPDGCHDRAHAIFAADALLLLSCMYPTTWSVSHDMIHPTWAAAVPALHQHVRATGMCAPLCQLVDEELLAQGRQWWSAFDSNARFGAVPDEHPCSRSAWHPENGVRLLLDALHEHDGRHNVSSETRDRVRTALERAVQAAWLVHSPDGVQRPPVECPAHEAATPADVRRPMIDPVFVGDDRHGIDARGCLVGLKPFQYRQICTLAMGADIDAVLCQVARNEGGLSLRVSSAADILDAAGKLRSDKSISPVQTESDESAFGTREDKIVGCRDQRAAWDANVCYLAPIFGEVRPPLPRERRLRGVHGRAFAMQQQATEIRMDQAHLGDDEAWARAAFERSASADAADATRLDGR